ncbi:MAG: hypothetical protein IJ188_03010 [Clostridia bacterium]|nr:hypothetical protein [Clostridia bacterium]
MDVRRSTCLIVRRGTEFLVGRTIITREFRWSAYPYDAWRTRSREDAEKVAHRVGGDLYLFNPVVGQLRAYKPANGSQQQEGGTA